MRAALFDPGDRQAQRLLLIIHHLVVDAVSWHVIVEDIETAYRQLAAGESIRLPAKTTSVRQWMSRLQEHVAAGGFDAEAAYWQREVVRTAPSLPIDEDCTEPNSVVSADVVSVLLPQALTEALLHDVPPVYGTQIHELIVAALALAFAGWTGQHELSLLMEGHGREDMFDDIDLSRTVGWFTSMFPVTLAVTEGDIGTTLVAVKEQLRGVPQRGVGYGALRYLHPDESLRASLAAAPEPQVLFNYLGQLHRTLPSSDFMSWPTAVPPTPGAPRHQTFRWPTWIGPSWISLPTCSKNKAELPIPNNNP